MSQSIKALSRTHYFGHKITEIQAVFGHHGTEDLCDWFRGLGFKTHGAVNRHQVQPKSKHTARVTEDAAEAERRQKLSESFIPKQSTLLQS